MFKFPTKVTVKAQNRIVCFHITEICHNVFAFQENLHKMQTEDNLTFGYIVYRDGYLYAYCIDAGDLSKHHLIHVSYVGPEDKITNAKDSDYITRVFESVGLTVAQFMLYENRHPAYLDKDTFLNIYESIRIGLDSEDPRLTTPYITPMRNLACELRDFYTDMAKKLEDIQENKTNES